MSDDAAPAPASSAPEADGIPPILPAEPATDSLAVAPSAQGDEKFDVGCLALMLAGFIGVFFLPAFFLLGGAPVIIPLIILLLLWLVSPFLNPAERFSGKAKLVGRLLTCFTLALLLLAAWYFFFLRELPTLAE